MNGADESKQEISKINKSTQTDTVKERFFIVNIYTGSYHELNIIKEHLESCLNVKSIETYIADNPKSSFKFYSLNYCFMSNEELQSLKNLLSEQLKKLKIECSASISEKIIVAG